jgi:hypothetical protein
MIVARAERVRRGCARGCGLHQTCWLRQHAPRLRGEAPLVVGVDGRDVSAGAVCAFERCTIQGSRVGGGGCSPLVDARGAVHQWLQPGIPLGCKENAKARKDNAGWGVRGRTRPSSKTRMIVARAGRLRCDCASVRGRHQTCWLRQHAPRLRGEAPLVVGVDGGDARAGAARARDAR